MRTATEIRALTILIGEDHELQGRDYLTSKCTVLYPYMQPDAAGRKPVQ